MLASKIHILLAWSWCKRSKIWGCAATSSHGVKPTGNPGIKEQWSNLGQHNCLPSSIILLISKAHHDFSRKNPRLVWMTMPRDKKKKTSLVPAPPYNISLQLRDRGTFLVPCVIFFSASRRLPSVVPRESHLPPKAREKPKRIIDSKMPRLGGDTGQFHETKLLIAKSWLWDFCLNNVWPLFPTIGIGNF